ncbi:unnamed protein product [uncultured bacterium]|nr:unnamed protein product [uncultured bacterium]
MILSGSCSLLAVPNFLAPLLQPIHQRRISHPDEPRKLRSGHPATIILGKQRLTLRCWGLNATCLINFQNL